MSILWILRAAGWMAEVGMPRAKGMFEVGTVGMLGAPEEGFWGATGSLGNLARAASISSLLIIAFVAALTCLGAIVPIIYLCTQSLSLLFRDKLLPFERLEQVSSEVFAGFPQTGKESEEVSQSQRITQIRNTDFPATPSAPGPAKCTLTKRPWSCLGK